MRAFTWYSGDHLKGIPLSDFSVKTAGFDTGKWRHDAVEDLLSKPQRLERLLTTAAKLVPQQEQVAKAQGPNSLYIRERSSSPPMYE